MAAAGLLGIGAILVACISGYFFLTESRLGTGRVKPHPVRRFAHMQEVLQEASLLQHVADDCSRGAWSFTTGDHVRKYVADNLEWSVKREVRTIRIVDLALSGRDRPPRRGDLDAIDGHRTYATVRPSSHARAAIDSPAAQKRGFELLIADATAAVLYSHYEDPDHPGEITYQIDPLPAGAAIQLFADLLPGSVEFDPVQAAQGQVFNLRAMPSPGSATPELPSGPLWHHDRRCDRHPLGGRSPHMDCLSAAADRRLSRLW